MTLITLVLALILGAPPAAAPPNPGSAGLERLKALAGDWTGRFEWSGERHDSGVFSVAYSLTGNGSAVVENLISEGTVTMTSVYHMDGPDLRMTHYCGAQNQPRLKAKRIDIASGSVDFEIVDVTNLRSKDAPHVQSVSLRFLDDDHVVLMFGFGGGSGVTSTERIEMVRTKKS